MKRGSRQKRGSQQTAEPKGPTAREAWEALLASLPLSEEQRRALTAAADDMAIDAAEAVASSVARMASEVGNAALAGCLGIAGAASRAKDEQTRAARDRSLRRP